MLNFRNLMLLVAFLLSPLCFASSAPQESPTPDQCPSLVYDDCINSGAEAETCTKEREGAVRAISNILPPQEEYLGYLGKLRDGLSALFDGWILMADPEELLAFKRRLTDPANINRPSNGLSPLHTFSMLGNLEFVQLLVEEGADLELVFDGKIDGKIAQQYSPLHFAVMGGSLEVVQFLVERGVDRNKYRLKSINPLLLACYGGDTEMVEWFMAPSLNQKTYNFQSKPDPSESES